MTDLIVQNETNIITGSIVYDNVYINTNGILLVQDAVLTTSLLRVSGSFAYAQAIGTGYIYITGSTTGSTPTGSGTGSFATGSSKIYDAYGNEIMNIIITEIIEGYEYKHAVLPITGGSYDIVQGLGTRNKVYRISGECLASLSGSRIILLALNGTIGSIQTRIIPETNILFHSIETKDKAGRPLEFTFQMEAVEIK